MFVTEVERLSVADLFWTGNGLILGFVSEGDANLGTWQRRVCRGEM